jgi:hypothetical protein
MQFLTYTATFAKHASASARDLKNTLDQLEDM